MKFAKRSYFSRSWQVIRWPVLLVFLTGSVIFLLSSLIQAVGWFGTTSLRPLTEKQKEWTDFEKLFQARAGAPFVWDGKKPTEEYGIIAFDKRLVRSLTYLTKRTNVDCGWDGRHDKITLSINAKANSIADYFGLPSTILRGTGVRIIQADYIKCSYKKICTPDPNWYKFTKKEIPFQVGKLVLPDPPQPPCTIVVCAVDYYPNYPVDASCEESTPPNDAPMLRVLNPGVFPYNSITENAKRAAYYKTAQIAYQLASIDRKNCEKPAGNLGWERNIPFRVIFPLWIVNGLGNTWGQVGTESRPGSGLRGYYKDNFALTALKKSPYTGLSSDLKLDNIGLQVSY